MAGKSVRIKQYQRAYAYAIDGNTVRKLADPDIEERLKERKKRHAEAYAIRQENLARMQQVKRKAHRMSRTTKLLWLGATFICAMAAIAYLQINDLNTRSIKQISMLQSELNTIKLKNDEAEARITGNIDLGEVRRIAIYELGMQYADEGQVVRYQDTGGDYVRQYQEIEKAKTGKQEAITQFREEGAELGPEE